MNTAQKTFLFATANPSFGGLAHLMAQDDASPSIQALTPPAALLSSRANSPRTAVVFVLLRRGDEPACLVVVMGSDRPIDNSLVCLSHRPVPRQLRIKFAGVIYHRRNRAAPWGFQSAI